MPARRQLPPFSTRLVHQLEENPDCLLWILHGQDGLELAEGCGPTSVLLALPPNTQPADFDWSVAARAKNPVILLAVGHADADDTLAIVTELLTVGVMEVVVIDDTGDGQKHYRRSTP